MVKAIPARFALGTLGSRLPEASMVRSLLYCSWVTLGGVTIGVSLDFDPLAGASTLFGGYPMSLKQWFLLWLSLPHWSQWKRDLRLVEFPREKLFPRVADFAVSAAASGTSIDKDWISCCFPSWWTRETLVMNKSGSIRSIWLPCAAYLSLTETGLKRW